MKLNNKEVRLIKDQKTGDFLLIGPGLLQEKVEGSVDAAWEKLQEQYDHRMEFFRTAGLQDEINGPQFKKAFEKNFWLESLIKGTLIAIPTFVAFLLFALIFTNRVSKLAVQLQEALRPFDEKGVSSEVKFKKTLERYRPYVYETLVLLEEEKQKAKAAVKE